MLKLGKWQELEVVREAPQGLYLSDGEEDVLIPNKYVPENPGSHINVFVYKDSQNRPIATTLKPQAEVDNFGVFTVKQKTSVGLFLDWGIEKDILLPFSEMTYEPEVGERVVVYITLDPKSNRIIASMHLRPFLDTAEHDLKELKEGQEVELWVSDGTSLGYEVLIDQKYLGLVYKDTVFTKLKPGEKGKGKIKTIRADGKIDVQWHAAATLGDDFIIARMKNNGGYLPLHDKSDPELIKKELGLSKKEFKRQIGGLYKRKLIEIKSDGIYLK